ncbi:MAG: hypothetical protein RL160_293 [Bacteroidota bacterium]|jgi:integrase/recombinase XerD
MAQTWEQILAGFQAYLSLERSLALHTRVSYLADVAKLKQWRTDADPRAFQPEDLSAFMLWIGALGFTPVSQARILSGVKAFYRYLVLDRQIELNPAAHLRTPKTGRKLPVFLSPDEVELMIQSVDRSKPFGERDAAILEVLYSCGLRVSELTGLKMQDVFAEESLLRVTGKGNKQRLVPIGGIALKQLGAYFLTVRNHQEVHPAHKDVVFLNRFGKQLSRVSVFTMIRDLASICGIQKSISPHTFRHSFATALVEAGADLRAVQEMLGHESITTTEIYTHLETDYLKSTIMQFHPASKRTRA